MGGLLSSCCRCFQGKSHDIESHVDQDSLLRAGDGHRGGGWSALEGEDDDLEPWRARLVFFLTTSDDWSKVRNLFDWSPDALPPPHAVLQENQSILQKKLSSSSASEGPRLVPVEQQGGGGAAFGGSNCLFAALIVGAGVAVGVPVEQAANDLRAVAVDWIRDNDARGGLRGFVGFEQHGMNEGDFDGYLKRMAGPSGLYGDHLVLIAATVVLGKTIRVHSAVQVSPFDITPPRAKSLRVLPSSAAGWQSPKSGSDCIHIGHLKDRFYCAVAPAN